MHDVVAARHFSLEICVDSAAGAVAAIAGGADRIELCAALDVGGLTPSAGLTVAVRERAQAAGVPVFAMVRPRSGNFAYDADEWAQATVDAKLLVDQGVDGLVFGACVGGILPDEPLGRWLEEVRAHAGRRIPCTFHRAVDVAADPVSAVKTIALLGFDRVLTSGGAVRAVDGAATIRAMVKRAGDRIAIMAGADVTAENAPALVEAGVGELHASASLSQEPLDPRIAELGFAMAPRRNTDEALVRALRTRLDALSTGP